MKTAPMKSVTEERLMSTYRRQPVTFVRGQGMFLYDESGKEYLDFVAGVAVVALGHAHPAVAEAIAKQARTLVHTSNLYFTEPMVRLAERLCDVLGWPDGKVFFANSGAEANECAMKLIRKWSREKYSPERYETIAANGSFHGRTFETLAATGQPLKWETFSPLPAGFTHVPFDDVDALSAAITDRTAAVMLEPVLGEGGVIVPSDDYLPAVRRVCDEHGLMFVADEVQTGLGRTGNWFAFQESGAAPDVITIAKALGNGLPVAACVARGEFAEVFQPGDHATTMGGGPVVCAAALKVLEVIESEGLVENARKLGQQFQSELASMAEKFELVKEVRGKGLLLALELQKEVARDLVTEALEAGLLVNELGPNRIRLSPPLIVEQEHCDRAVELLSGVISRMEERVQ
jgi:acetylornithine/N-succinyldiaminopimelate aminotransferase